MADNTHERMTRWCDQYGLRWGTLTLAQADRAEQLARAPVALLPEGLRGGLMRWIVKGIPTGSFLAAVLRNDLKDACARIDDDNRPFLPDVVRWLYNYAPACCWGSPERVSAWHTAANAINPEEVPG